MSVFDGRADRTSRQPLAPALDAPAEAADPAPRAFTNRYEVKYVLPTSCIGEIQDAVGEYLRPDANGVEGGGYYVHSIYFDSPNFRFLREKFEGDLTRIKPRIRSYRASLDGPPTGIFLEMKGRYDRIVQKRRCPIDRTMAELLMTELPVHPNGWSARHSVLGEFLYLSHRFHLNPTVSVLYHRLAYFADLWPDLRLTFDRLVLCSSSVGLGAPSEAFSPTIPSSQFVLELKYNNKLPRLLLGRLHGLGLQQRSFSKYAASAQRCLSALNGHGTVH